MNYTVTITSVAGKDYASDATPTEPIIDAHAVANALVEQNGQGATADCGPTRFVQLPVNATFSCRLVRGGQSRAVTLTVTDAQGDVSVG